MCIVTAYKSESCDHRWMTITKFCAPNMGFTHTPHHEFRPSDTTFLGKPVFETAAANTCPNCDKKGQYDGNKTRMVLKNKAGCRVACGVGAPNGPVGMGMYPYTTGHGYYVGGNGLPIMQPWNQMGGYPGGGIVLSPLQQRIEANRVAAEAMGMRFHPIREDEDERRCAVM